MPGTVGVILAAGLGKRMKSDTVKVLHHIGGKPMIMRVVDALRNGGADKVVAVVGHQQDRVRQSLGSSVLYAVQEMQLGTGHALMQARELASDDGVVVVINGDVPLVTAEDIESLVAEHRRSGAAASLISVEVDDPKGYGRIYRSDDDTIVVVEDKNTTAEQRKIKQVNAGVYCFSSLVWDVLDRVGKDPISGEFYLVDALHLLQRDGHKVCVVQSSDADSFVGINDRCDLARAERIFNSRILAEFMKQGVTIVDPSSTWIEDTVEIERDCTIHPFTVIRGKARIEARTEIGPHSVIDDARIGADVVVIGSVISDSLVADGCQIGPYSHLRPGNELSFGVKVGNYAELKNSTVGEKSKVPHHSYLGDADVGAGVNVGAGTITVNYDGACKHRTDIEDDVFIGCNSNLIAPVTIKTGAYVAAGSTITTDVPADSLAVSRSKQRTIDNWAQRRKGGKKQE